MNDNAIAVILNYKNGELTARCVKSLIGKIGRIYVVDNSSTQEQSNKLSVALEAIRLEKGEAVVKVANPKTNLGFGRGVQFGLDYAWREAEFDMGLIINNDAISSDEMVGLLSESLRNYDNRALVAPGTAQGSTPSRLWYHRFFALVLRRPFPGAFPYLSGACLMVPWQLTQSDLFDPDFFMYGEDVELSWRMAKMQVPLKVVDAAKYVHLGSATSREGSLFYEYHVARGHILLARKLAVSRLDLLWLLSGRVISLPVRATLRCMRQRSFVPWHALLRACINRTPPSPEE